MWNNNGSLESMISSTKNIVKIKYNTQNRYPIVNNIDSFRIEWIVDGCGGILKQFKGELTSPKYPRSSPINSTCEWNIITEYGLTIEISIQDFMLESSSLCSLAFLSVRLKKIKMEFLCF